MKTETRIEIPEAHYSLFETERDDKPAMVVVNTPALSLSDRWAFPWHLTIVIRAAKVARNGMPPRNEVLVLDQLGDVLEQMLDRAKSENDSMNVLFLARVTCDSQRELIFRVHDAEVANSVLQRAARVRNERDWSFEISADESWKETDIYQALVDSCRD